MFPKIARARLRESIHGYSFRIHCDLDSIANLRLPLASP